MFFVVYYYCTIIENVSRNKVINQLLVFHIIASSQILLLLRYIKFNCFSKFSNYGEKKKKQLCDVILEPDAGLNWEERGICEWLLRKKLFFRENGALKSIRLSRA